MPTQSEAGKAFEYALIRETNSILSINFTVIIVDDIVYQSAFNSFNAFNERQQSYYLTAAREAIHHIITLEPRLSFPVSENDGLELKLMPDSAGQHGDVRDILLIRSLQNWEIGISAKNNHMAVKHSRLSNTIDFGQSWLSVPCSQDYFNEIDPIFQTLRELQINRTLWRDVTDKAINIYVPLLTAFKRELLNINRSNPNIPQRLISYLIGNHDFYKVIKRKRKTELYAFNINGTLNKNRPGSRQHTVVSRLRLPSEIIRLDFKPGSTNTIILVCDEGWTISFRIHSAESLVISSLKFDITLTGHPHSLYSHHVNW